MSLKFFLNFLISFLLYSCVTSQSNTARRFIASKAVSAKPDVNCFSLVAELTSKDQGFENVMLSNPYKQLMTWEQSENLKVFRKGGREVNLGYIHVDSKELDVKVIAKSAELEKLLIGPNGSVRWYKHPLNYDDTVPFYQNKPDGSIITHFSASRSMFVGSNEGTAFSIKLPTNNPHPNSQRQPKKADLSYEITVSMSRSKQIQEIDKKVGSDQNLQVLTEVASVSSKKGGNGFLVRDLTPLLDGHYYLPAFAIPSFGRKVASWLGRDFSKLWGKFYASNVGKAKAKMLLRYGLEMETPNAQNILIQLDKSLIPTGKIVMRDVADCNIVGFVAKENGSNKYMLLEEKADIFIVNKLTPNFNNSVWMMDETSVRASGNFSPDYLIDESTISSWSTLHDEAYINMIKSELELSKEFDSVFSLENYLKSGDGVNALRAYAKKMKLVD